VSKSDFDKMYHPSHTRRFKTLNKWGVPHLSTPLEDILPIRPGLMEIREWLPRQGIGALSLGSRALSFDDLAVSLWDPLPGYIVQAMNDIPLWFWMNMVDERVENRICLHWCLTLRTLGIFCVFMTVSMILHFMSSHFADDRGPSSLFLNIC